MERERNDRVDVGVGCAYWMARLVMRVIFFFGAKIRVLFPTEGLPRHGGVLLVSNHISHFDPPLISVCFPRAVDWLAMRELYSTGWSRRVLAALNAIPIRRGAPDLAALREALGHLARGRVVGIFPEGGIRDGEGSLLNGATPQRGAALLARMSGAPVVPCAIVGTDRLYNYRRWLVGGRAPVWVCFGSALTGIGRDEEFRKMLTASMERMKRRILTEGGAKEDDLPRPPRVRMAET